MTSTLLKIIAGEETGDAGTYVKANNLTTWIARTPITVEKGAKVVNSVLMHGTVVKAGASLAYVIADKNVTVNEDRMLMGHASYPLAIAKGTVV